MDTVRLDPADLLISLDVVSLFTRVLIKPLELLFSSPGKYVLRSTYLIYDGVSYRQVEGIVIGSPLSSVMTAFFMKAFESEVLNAAP